MSSLKYHDIKNMPKLCHLHLHFNAMLEPNEFKKYCIKKKVNIL
jgi:hypothetical protein